MLFQPHPYQEFCIEKIVDDPCVGLFLDMGLGKTVITLTAINELRYNRWAVQRVLVIAPRKVAEATWQAEAARWDHLQHLRFSAVLGSENKRIRALATPADIYMISRDNVVWPVSYTHLDVYKRQQQSSTSANARNRQYDFVANERARTCCIRRC